MPLPLNIALDRAPLAPLLPRTATRYALSAVRAGQGVAAGQLSERLAPVCPEAGPEAALLVLVGAGGAHPAHAAGRV